MFKSMTKDFKEKTNYYLKIGNLNLYGEKNNFYLS